MLVLMEEMAIPAVSAGDYSGMPFTRQFAVDLPKNLMLKTVFLQDDTSVQGEDMPVFSESEHLSTKRYTKRSRR